MSFSLETIGAPVPLDVDQRINAAIAFLGTRGFHITLPAEKAVRLTPAQVADRVGLPINKLSARLHRRACPPFEATRGPSGRILRMRLNPALEAYLRLPSGQGSSLAKRLTSSGLDLAAS